MGPVLGLIIAYLAGSIPSAYLAGRLTKGIDLRTIGSGNLGATNVYRNLGAPAAIVVLLADALKGALPVALLPALTHPDLLAGSDAALWWALAYGVMAIVGHAKPVFLLWRGGGKGVATAAGVFAVLAPVGLALAVVGFATVVWRTRFVSLASMVAALLLALILVWQEGVTSPITLVSGAVALFVLWSHRANIGRLRRGEEPRLGRTASGESSR